MKTLTNENNLIYVNFIYFLFQWFHLGICRENNFEKVMCNTLHANK